MIYMINMIPRFSARDRIVAFRECVGVWEIRTGVSREAAKPRRGAKGIGSICGLAFRDCVKLGGPVGDGQIWTVLGCLLYDVSVGFGRVGLR